MPPFGHICNPGPTPIVLTQRESNVLTLRVHIPLSMHVTGWSLGQVTWTGHAAVSAMR